MNFLKQLKYVIFVLLPVCLLAMQQDTGTLPALDKNKAPILWQGAPVVLEWYRITDYKTYFDKQMRLASVVAESFADEAIDFLLDEKLQIKKEYVDTIKELSKNDREEIESLIKASLLSRKERVEYVRKRFLEMLEKAKTNTQEIFPGVSFIVIAKSKGNDILGFAIFIQEDKELQEAKALELDLLAIPPEARGYKLSWPLVFSALEKQLMPEIKYIFLGTKSWNTTAHAVYKKLGFTVCKIGKGNISFEYEVKNK